MDREDRKTPANKGRIQRHDHPKPTRQAQNRHRQQSEGAAGSSPKGRPDRRRSPLSLIDRILWGG